jgi:hypothetical protein
MIVSMDGINGVSKSYSSFVPSRLDAKKYLYYNAL